MPASKRTTKKGKFIELARKKAFQKKENQKETFYISPQIKQSWKIARRTKIREILKINL